MQKKLCLTLCSVLLSTNSALSLENAALGFGAFAIAAAATKHITSPYLKPILHNINVSSDDFVDTAVIATACQTLSYAFEKGTTPRFVLTYFPSIFLFRLVIKTLITTWTYDKYMRSVPIIGKYATCPSCKDVCNNCKFKKESSIIIWMALSSFLMQSLSLDEFLKKLYVLVPYPGLYKK